MFFFLPLFVLFVWDGWVKLLFKYHGWCHNFLVSLGLEDNLGNSPEL